MTEERQYAQYVTDVKELPDRSRVLRFVGTTDVEDRMGDVVEANGWDFTTYQKAPRFLWAHEHHDLPIGRTISIQPCEVEGQKGWSFDVEFARADENPKAEQCFKLAKRGFLNTVSVGFRSLDSEFIQEDENAQKKRKDEKPDTAAGFKFKKKELLELSLVNVPANPQALMIEIGKGLDVPPETRRAAEQKLRDDGVLYVNAIDMESLEKTLHSSAEWIVKNVTDKWSNFAPQQKMPLGWSPRGPEQTPVAPPATGTAESQPEPPKTDPTPAPPPEPPKAQETQTAKEVSAMADTENKPDTSMDAMKAVTEGIKTLTDEIADLKKRYGDSLVQVKSKNLPSDAEIAEKRKEYAAKKRNPNELPPEDEFSFIRCAIAQINRDWSLAPYEKYAIEQGSKKLNELATNEKAIAWASGSAGGYWVPEEFLPEQFYMDFVANLVARKAGIFILPCRSAPVLIPRVSAGGTAYWVAQNANLTESAPTPNQLSMQPKWCTARVQISQFLAQTSAGAAERIVRQEIARRIALAVDDAVLEGTGTSGKPIGLAATSSINTVAIGADGGTFTPAHAFSMLYALEYDNVPMDGVSWIFHPRTWNTFRQSTVGSDTYNYLLWQNQTGSIANATRYELLGYPVYTTTQMTINGTKGSGTNLARILLANWKECILAEWGGLEVKATDVGGLAWQQNAIEFKGTYCCDVAVRDANAVCLLSDSTS
jgi:HK97 family phage major capsid protein/HK97 family phage prohead protease